MKHCQSVKIRAINPIKKEESLTKDGNKSNYSYAGKKLEKKYFGGPTIFIKTFQSWKCTFKKYR